MIGAATHSGTSTTHALMVSCTSALVRATVLAKSFTNWSGSIVCLASMCSSERSSSR